MNNVSAAILKAQIERKDEILKNRFRLYEQYDSIVSKYNNFGTQFRSTQVLIAPWSYPLTFDAEKISQQEVINEFDQKGIETRPFFIPIHTMPPYLKFFNGLPLLNTDKVSVSGINLPTASNFTKRELKYLFSSLQSILEKFSAYSN
jgi:perosamine synthetase